MRYLKQNTDQYILIGPALDRSDGITPEDALTVTSFSGVIVRSTQSGASSHTDFTPSATGANDWGMVAVGHGGFYDLKVPDSEINFVGSCKLGLWYSSECLPIWEEFMVVPANVWDSLMGTDLLDINVSTIKEQSLTCAAPVTILASLGTASTSTAQTGDSYAIVNSGTYGNSAIKTAVDGVSSAIVSGTPQNTTASANTLDRGTAYNNTGGSGTSTYADTYLDNGLYLVAAPLGSTATVNGIATVGLFEQLTFLLGTKHASTVTINGHYAGGASPRVCDVYAYNYVNAVWEKISDSITRMNNSSTDVNYTYTLLSAHQKNHTTGDGEVKIAFVSSSTNTGDRLWIDQILVAGVEAGATAGEIADAVYLKMAYTVYDGSIWVDTVNGTDGSAIGTNGTPTRPVKTITSARELASSLGVKRYFFLPETSPTNKVTMDADMPDSVLDGQMWYLDMAGYDLSNSLVRNCEMISGTATSDVIEFVIRDSHLGAVTLPEVDVYNSVLTNITTLSEATSYFFNACWSAKIGVPTPTINFNSLGGATVLFPHWSGPLTVSNMAIGDTFIIDGNGELTIDSTCAGGTIIVAGGIVVTDNVVGGFAGLSDKSTAIESNVEGHVATAVAAEVVGFTRTSGTLTADGSEQLLYEVAAPTGNWIPDSIYIDLSNMSTNDVVSVKEYSKIKSGGAYVLFDIHSYSGVQTVKGIMIKGSPNRYGYKITLQQTAGTNRDFDYERFVIE